MHKIQYISQGSNQNEQLENIRYALDLGCLWIQLRFKEADKNLLVETAKIAKSICKEYNAILIINDHVDVAKEIDADGVHLGLSDSKVSDAKKILGDEKIIGGTANTYNDVIQRVKEKCSYIGLGPFQFTSTKKKLSPILGVSGYMEIIEKLKKDQIKTPIYAIGGIKECDISSLFNIGLNGIAVSGLLTNRDIKIDLSKYA